MFCFSTSHMSQRLQKNAVSDSIFHVMLSFFWNEKISSTYELGTLTHYQQKQTIPNVWIKRKKKIPQCSCYWQTAENNLLINLCVQPDFLKSNTDSILMANVDCAFLLIVQLKETHEKLLYIVVLQWSICTCKKKKEEKNLFKQISISKEQTKYMLKKYNT